MSMTGANRTPIGMPVPKPVVNTGGMSLLKPSYLKSGTEQSQPAPASQVVNQFHQPDYSQFAEAQNYTEEQAYGDIPSSFNKPPSIDKPPKNEKSADKDYRRHDDRDRGRRDRYDDRDRGDRRNRDRHDNRDRDRERHDHRDRDYRDRSYDRDDYRSSRSSNSSARKRDTSSDREQEINDKKKKRKSRFGDETEKAFIPGMPTMLPSNLTKDQEEAYLAQLQIEELSRKLRTGDLGIPVNPEERSPSPEPIYDTQGKRLNTREFRTRRKLEEERHRLIERMKIINPEYKPPADYRPPANRVCDKVMIPQDENPDINFVGLLIGPRGNTLKSLEKDTGAKIIIRGKGSVKEGKVGRKDGQPLPGEDEPLHAYITASSAEAVKKAVEKVKEVIRQGIEVPEGQNDLRRMQLRELALLNGTLRDTDQRCSNCGATDHKSWQCQDKPNVTHNIICTICGGAGHIAKDCKVQKPPGGLALPFDGGDKGNIDEEYMSLMAELGETPPAVKTSGMAGQQGVPRFSASNLFNRPGPMKAIGQAASATSLLANPPAASAAGMLLRGPPPSGLGGPPTSLLNTYTAPPPQMEPWKAPRLKMEEGNVQRPSFGTRPQMRPGMSGGTQGSRFAPPSRPGAPNSFRPGAPGTIRPGAPGASRPGVPGGGMSQRSLLQGYGSSSTASQAETQKEQEFQPQQQQQHKSWGSSLLQRPSGVPPPPGTDSESTAPPPPPPGGMMQMSGTMMGQKQQQSQQHQQQSQYQQQQQQSPQQSQYQQQQQQQSGENTVLVL
ncbi:splicing factor 1-like [Artemia franciscana]|uniref:splicing factor 1-like n=1 Tax=Artemia franciscana TaxID=6661 RepID=UPI0032DB643A